MKISLELVRRRLLQCSPHRYEPWEFRAIPEFVNGNLSDMIEYHQKILDYMETMSEESRDKFENLKDRCGCTGRTFLDTAEEKLARAIARKKESHE